MTCAVGGDRYAATKLSSKGYRNKEPLPLGRGCPECAVRLLKGSVPAESNNVTGNVTFSQWE